MQRQDEIDLVDDLRYHIESFLNLRVQMDALLAALKQTNHPLYTSYIEQVKILEKGIPQRPESAALSKLQDLAAKLRER